MSYKAEHEAFVSGSKGSTHSHILLTLLPTTALPFLSDMLVTAVPAIARKTDTFWARWLFDFVVIIIPLQLMNTVLNHVQLQCACVMAITFVAVWYLALKKQSSTTSVEVYTMKMTSRRPFITYYRAIVNVVTSFSILAVDFTVFPRELAKAETYGTGLMDGGVGCFLLTNAIVSLEARGKSSSDNLLKSVLKSLKSSIPLLVLGTGRVLAVKSTGYQEHVTEYGVHWNFFFTLAVVKVACTIMFCTVPQRFWNMSAVLIIAVYQHNLSYDGLKDYIVKGYDGKGGRHGFVDANREGLYSCIGYLCVYILGVQLGKLLMKPRETGKDWVKACIHLTFVTAGSWGLVLMCEKYVEPVSRRFANLGYVLWIVACNSIVLVLLLILDIITTYIYHVQREQSGTEAAPTEKNSTDDTGYQASVLMYSINYNGLAYFLLANVLTGLTNMCVRTIYQPSTVATVILTLYMLAVTGGISFLYHKKISFKIDNDKPAT